MPDNIAESRRQELEALLDAAYRISSETSAEVKQILARWGNDALGNSIAIGASSVHNAVAHLKIVIVDGVYMVKASANWSLSGEQRRDTEVCLSRNAVIAAETRAILDINHDFMLKRMARTQLDVTKPHP